MPQEAELAEQFHASRQAIREALKVLAAKGLILTRRRIGSTVMPRANWNLLDPDVLAWHAPANVSAAFLRDLVEFRVLVEPIAARLAASRGSPEQIARIADAVEGMRAHTHDTKGFYEADLAFHVGIFAASGNSLIARLSTIVAPLLRVSFSVQSSIAEEYDWAVGGHERVFLAIARRDADAAQATMGDVLAVYKGQVDTITQRSEATAVGRDADSDDGGVGAPGGAAGGLYPSGDLHGQVAHRIGIQIVSGAISPGDILPPEEELAVRYGVGRQAIREGLKVLAAKGLVTTRRRIGTTVVPRNDWNLLDPDLIAWHHPTDLPFDFLADLIELRQLIEPATAAMAAQRRDSEQMARISAAMAEMRSTAADPDWVDADVEFHMAIAAASGNTIIENLSRILAPLLQASMEGQGNLAPTLEMALDVHAAIEEGIAARDPARASEAMAAMLTLTDSKLHEILGEGAQRSG